MSYKVFIYAFMLLTTIFSLSGINYTSFFKKNHAFEAKIFVILIALSISFLASEFIINFIELT